MRLPSPSISTRLAEDRLFYGWKLRTHVPLPSLPALSGQAKPDLTLVRGPVPDRLPQAAWTSPFVEIGADGSVLIRIPDVVKFLILDPHHLILDQECKAETSVIETFLFSAVTGILLHQQGVLPLHASCVMVGDVAIAMAGVSGRGKSTLAGILSQRGHDVVTDDICPVSFQGGGVFITPGPPRIRLWPDASDLLGLSHAGLATARPRHPKRVLVAPGTDAGPKPLGALIRLAIDKRLEAPVLCRLSGPAAITPMEELVYRARLGRRLGRRIGLFQDLARLAAAVPFYQLVRPEGAVDPSLLADLVTSTVNKDG